MSQAIDIILPCYNPGKNWHVELLDFNKVASKIYNIHYIIVNDGSTNGFLKESIDLLKEAGVAHKLVSYEVNMGKGFALRKGVLSSTRDTVIYTDIDFPFTNQSTLRMIDMLMTNQYDVLAGNRSEAYYQKKMSFFRIYLSKTFRLFLRKMVKLRITDTQCGLKGFTLRGKEEFLKTRINRYLFDFEFIYNCHRNTEIKLAAVEVELKNNVVFSKMKPKIVLQETINLLNVIWFKRR